MRTRWPAALLLALSLAVPAAAPAAGTLAVTSPGAGQVTGTTPEFAGTGLTDGAPSVSLIVGGPSGFTTATPLYGDGTWSLAGRQLLAGAYTVQACQNDAGGAQACSAVVSFTVRGAGGGSFTAKAPRGTFRDLLAGRMSMPVHCPQDCTVAARLIVAAQDARHMGFPLWRSNQLVATEDDNNDFAAGDARLGLAVFPSIRPRLRDALAFPLFGSVRIKVELQADWGEGSNITSVTGPLLWPGVGGDHGGRRGTIRGISVDGPASLGARVVRFTVRLAPGSGTVTGGVRSAGGAVRSTNLQLDASPAQLARGGTFRGTVAWSTAAVADAATVTPLAAEVFVRRGGTRAARRFVISG